MNENPWRDLDLGGTGQATTGAQYLLRAHGHAIAADGIYGPVTAGTVRAFRTGAGLPSAGMIDRDTWIALVIATRQGDSGDAVRAVQQFPLQEHPIIAVDGDYGPVTKAAVEAFQGTWGLTVDGVAGRETWSFLQFGRADGLVLWPLAKVGQTQATNRRVLAVQYLLNHAGAALFIDGQYGPVTGEAMRQWQLAQRARYVSTTCGQLDWPLLTPTIRRGDNNLAVAAMQSQLYDVVIDGDFGPVTEREVQRFQLMFGLSTDGVVDPATWAAIIGPWPDHA